MGNINFIPMSGYYLVSVEKAVATSASGIVLSSKEEKEESVSEVLRVPENNDGDINVGDRVYYSKYGGIDIIIDNIQYLVLKKDEIFGLEKYKDN